MDNNLFGFIVQPPNLLSLIYQYSYTWSESQKLSSCVTKATMARTKQLNPTMNKTAGVGGKGKVYGGKNMSVLLASMTVPKNKKMMKKPGDGTVMLQQKPTTRYRPGRKIIIIMLL